MDYFSDVLTTFMLLEHDSCIAVYAEVNDQWQNYKKMS